MYKYANISLFTSMQVYIGLACPFPMLCHTTYIWPDYDVCIHKSTPLDLLWLACSSNVILHPKSAGNKPSAVMGRHLNGHWICRLKPVTLYCVPKGGPNKMYSILSNIIFLASYKLNERDCRSWCSYCRPIHAWSDELAHN